METSSLVAAWESLPEDPAIAYFGQDTMLRGRRIDILDYKGFTEQEKLDALNSLVPNKHALVLAPSTTGSFVPISEMSTEALIFSATLKARTESCAIIDSEIRPVFDELVSLLEDSDSGVAAQALENLQDMVFDQTMRQMSKGHVKYCFIYLDDLLNDQVMIIGNRKTLSFDLKKIKALQFKIQDLLHGAPTAPKISPPARNVKPKNTKPKPKAKSSSEDSSSESESSSSSSSSSSSDSEQGGLIPEGSLTPVFFPKSAPAKNLGGLPGDHHLSPADTLLQETIAAKALLMKAQETVAALEARGLALQTPPANQLSGPALKTPHPALEDYSIPKKSAMLKEAEEQHSRNAKGSKKAEKAAKKPKKSKRGKKHSKKHKHAKKARVSNKKAKPSSSESKTMTTESGSGSASDSPPPKDDHTSQVLCSVCCKNTAHPALK